MTKKETAQRAVCIILIAFMLNLSFFPAFGQSLPSSGAAEGAQADTAQAGQPETISLAPDTGNQAGTALSLAPDTVSPAGTPAAGTPAGTPTVVTNPNPITVEFGCSSPESSPGENVLKPQEVAKLKRLTEVENPAFEIDNINSGRGPNPERDELANDIIVQKQPDGSAVATQVSGSKVDPGEMSQWFNRWFDGPFAFGVSLDDTMRIGQCRNLSKLDAEKRGCPVTGKQLSFRNSGEGIVENFKNVWDDVKEIFTGEEQGQYTKEELEKVQTNLASETDPNLLRAKFLTRKTELIPNSVKTDEFTATMATTGSDSSSLISIYSMFDKYFNSWFSSEMVITTFGPTLFGQAKKYAGWMVRRGMPGGGADNGVISWVRRNMMAPDQLLGEARLKRMVIRTDRYGFGDAWTKGIENADWDSGYAFVKGASFRRSVNEWGKAGGYLDEMTDPVTRGEFFKQIKDLRGYAHANKAIYSNAKGLYDDAVKKFGANSAEARAALIDFGKTNAKLHLLADGSYLKLDAAELWVHEDWTGLYNMAVKQKGVDTFSPLSGDSKFIQTVEKGFIDDAWGNPTFPFETTQEGYMQLYKLSKKGELIDTVTVDDLRKNYAMYADKMAITERGEAMKIDGSTVDFIAKESTGNVKIYAANWVPADPETPEMFAKRLTHGRAARISTTMPDNMDRLYNMLVERNFAGQSRRYFSALDKAFAQEQELLKSYFSVKGGLKWTVMPFLYWQGKRGFGYEGMSAFQLPDSWKEVEVYTEDSEIFDDAFIEVFAQHGSDEGEIFSQVLNKLPWKMIYDKIAENFAPDSVNNTYQSWTNPLSGWRRTTENVAYFTSTRNDCATCKVIFVPKITSKQELAELKEKGRGTAMISFIAQQDMKSYFLEDILNEDTKEEGTTLIAFAHHTDIKGQSIGGDAETPPIDLVEAKKDKERCSDAVKKVGMGFLGDNPQRAAAILAFGESLGYALFFWSGILGTVVQQTLIVPELQDCVDDVDGYYIHMYAAYDKSKAKESSETTGENASKNAGDVVQNIKDVLLGKKPVEVKKEDDEKKPPLDSENKAYTAAAMTPAQKEDRPLYDRAKDMVTGEKEESKGLMETIKQQISDQMEKISQKAKAKDILQMNVETQGDNKGVVVFEKMFFFWFKGDTEQAFYDNQSKKVLEDTENKVSVTVDKEKGTISVKKEGKPEETVITSPDQVRLSGTKGKVPAEAIPQRIGRIILPGGPAVELFSMDWRGDFQVLDASVLDCIKRNVLEQTGVPLNTNKITDAFGPVQAIVTDMYPSITASTRDRSITANGSLREIVYGDNARVLVMSDMNTTMLDGRAVPAGKFSSVQFNNGVILYKPPMDGRAAELLIWLRYHEKSILSNDDVSGLRATVADPVINPETGCPEPAINLEALPNLAAGPNSAITEKVDNFNKSIAKMGPFQTFDTTGHRFMFYSQKTSPDCNPSQPGCCQDRVRIIDKKTGNVIDEPLAGPIEQTPTGIKFTTIGPDGKQTEHTLDFSADNGVPKISYDGMAPETLTMARGPNGSFWYDPETGLWYPYNAQLLPELEAFKALGYGTQHREDCSTSTMPSANTLNVDFGGSSDTPFNLPSMPLQPIEMMLFLLSLLAAICVARFTISRRFET